MSLILRVGTVIGWDALVNKPPEWTCRSSGPRRRWLSAHLSGTTSVNSAVSWRASRHVGSIRPHVTSRHVSSSSSALIPRIIEPRHSWRSIWSGVWTFLSGRFPSDIPPRCHYSNVKKLMKMYHFRVESGLELEQGRRVFMSTSGL